jgi:hypothetical protein
MVKKEKWARSVFLGNECPNLTFHYWVGRFLKKEYGDVTARNGSAARE